MKSIIRNFIAKQIAGRSDDGIMITLKDPQKVNMLENIMADLLMRNGIDPAAITSEAQLKMILNQIEAASKQTTQSGIRNVESAKVFDLKGKQIKNTDNIMGGEEMPPPGSRGGPDDIAAPVQSAEETIKNMIEAENKKNIAKMKQRKMLNDAIEDASPGFANDIKVDAELVAENLAERMGLVYDDLPTKQRLDIYDQAYTGLSKQRFKGMKKPDDPEEFQKGGIARIGLKEGITPSFEDYMKERRDIEKKQMLEQMYKEYLEDLRRKKVADQKQMVADGGRIGFFMGSQFPKGLATLREMVKFFSKGKDKERTGSEILSMVNPKQFNRLLNDPNIYRKFDMEQGIGAPELIKKMQGEMGKNRMMMIEEILGAAKNIRKADLSTIERKNEIIEEMIKKGIDRETAGEMADTIVRMAEATAGMRSTPKLTDEGILELENILKNMETGGKDKRSLNADGGRIGLKDGPKMNRRTFLKYLAGFASIPIIGKIVKPLKTVKGVKNVPIIKTSDVAGKPEWFDQLVNKVIIEGDDVSKRFATKDREIVHTKKIDDDNEVTVYQDLDEGTIRVDYDAPSNMGEDTVSLQYKPGRMDESTGKKPKDEFEASELEPRYVGGPEDADIEFDGLGGGSSIKMLESDVSKLKEYATGQKPTMKEFVESKKRKDRVKAINEDTMEQAEYISGKYGDGPEPDFDDIEDFAKGGIARMLGE